MNESIAIPERPLTLAEAADYLQIPLRSMRDLASRKKISHSRLDYRNWRFKKADLDGFLEKNRIVIGR